VKTPSPRGTAKKSKQSIKVREREREGFEDKKRHKK